MKRFALAAAVTATLVVPAVGAEPDDLSDEYKRLQGTWELVETWKNGKESVPEPGRGIIFDGQDTIQLPLLDPLRPLRGSFTLGNREGVKQIERRKEIQGRSHVTRGVYEVIGDTLTVCYATDPKVQLPRMLNKFVKDDQGTIHVYKRASTKGAKGPLAKDTGRDAADKAEQSVAREDRNTFLGVLKVGQVVHFDDRERTPFRISLLAPSTADEHRQNVQRHSYYFEVSKLGDNYVELSQPNRRYRLPLGLFFIYESTE